MKQYTLFLFFLLAATGTVLLPAKLSAQPVKNLPKISADLSQNALRNLPAVLPKLERSAAAALAAQKALPAPRVAPAPDIRLSVAQLQSAMVSHIPNPQNVSSTAFVFKTSYNGKEEIWAATAAHVAKGMGPDVMLIFYHGKKQWVVQATVAQYGPNILSDMALLKITQPLPPQVVPLPLSDTPAQLGEKLVSAGYGENKFRYTGLQPVFKNNQRFIRTNFKVGHNKRAGLCGSPLLNHQGEVVGIHCGSLWGTYTAFAADIQALPYLLKAEHEGTAEFPILVHGKVLGYIDIKEHIHSVEALEADGKQRAQYDTENRLPQSVMAAMLDFPETRYLRFLLEKRETQPTEFNLNNKFRYLIYDKQTGETHFEPVVW